MTRRVDRGRRLQLTSRPVSGPLMSRPPGADDGGERPREFVQSVERGLAIIRSFGPDSPVQTVSDMAAKTGLTRATARRFLITLMELGYIQTDGRNFELTPRVLELGYSFLSGLGLPDVALPHLERLVAEVDESSEASVLDGEDIVYVVRVPSTSIMTLSLNVGARMPAHATSMGKVLLAGLSEAELDADLAGADLKPYRPKTITDRETLRTEIVQAREQGYAVVDQELEDGLVAIAVPVHDRAGRTIAAVNLSTHIARRDVESMRADLLEPLQRAAQAIEADMAGVR